MLHFIVQNGSSVVTTLSQRDPCFFLELSNFPRLNNFNVKQEPGTTLRRTIGHNASGFTASNATAIGHFFDAGVDCSED